MTNPGKLIQNFYRNYSFPGHEIDRFLKTNPFKSQYRIMSQTDPWKTHPLPKILKSAIGWVFQESVQLMIPFWTKMNRFSLFMIHKLTMDEFIRNWSATCFNFEVLGCFGRSPRFFPDVIFIDSKNSPNFFELILKPTWLDWA